MKYKNAMVISVSMIEDDARAREILAQQEPLDDSEDEESNQ